MRWTSRADARTACARARRRVVVGPLDDPSSDHKASQLLIGRGGGLGVGGRWCAAGLAGGGRASGQSIGGTAHQPLALVRAPSPEARGSRLIASRGSSRRAGRARSGATGGPGRRGGPVARRIAPDRRFLGRRVARQLVRVGLVVSVLRSGGGPCRLRLRHRRRPGPIALAARVRRFAPRPVLEGRADRERARQAIRLLVRRGARGRDEFGIAAVPMVGARRARLPIVLERHERAGRRAVHTRELSLGHRRDDTRRRAGRAGPPETSGFSIPGPVGSSAGYGQGGVLPCVTWNRSGCASSGIDFGTTCPGWTQARDST